MSNYADTLHTDAFRIHLETNGRNVTLSSGATFQALLQSQQALDPAMMLGLDPREANTLMAIRDDVPDELLSFDSDSQINADVDGTAVSILSRDDNPSNPFVTFKIAKKL